MLREKGTNFEEVDLNKGLSAAQLEKLIGKRDYKDFLNTRNELYRERGMKENPPSLAEAIKLFEGVAAAEAGFAALDLVPPEHRGPVRDHGPAISSFASHQPLEIGSDVM